MATEQRTTSTPKTAAPTPTARPAAPAPSGPGPSWPLLTDDDIFLFNEGTHYRLHDKLGAHPVTHNGARGVGFAVWAPNARYVSVIGDFNDWDRARHPLTARALSGIWEGFIPGVPDGATYKFHIASKIDGYEVDKSDPFGAMREVAPRTASIVRSLDYAWGDAEWMRARGGKQGIDKPMSIYECHLGSWMRIPEEGNRSLTYRELAPKLAAYLKTTGFTHAEFLPVMEYPYLPSWGYQTTGYFAPTSRYGTPQDFMFLVDHLHQNGIGVILDWVPSHFPTDEHGPGYFDGTHLFEHADPRQGFHPDWKSAVFNYGRNEVRAFLISSAMRWLERYHADGIRVDAVASMLYLDYSREPGEWIPNQHGGRENLEAIGFLRQFNTEVYRSFPDTFTIAEESTSWPMVSRPTYVGGLGFGYKWDMGWMHDTLEYLTLDPVHRRFHHNALTFRSIYQSAENFVLPLSHDEVVHLKGSLLTKMPGDEWQRFANLRLLLAYQWCQPGKKLLFMGGEIAQWGEWNFDASLDWHLLDNPLHAGVQRLVGELNRRYREEPALHAGDCRPDGFAYIDANDSEQSVISFRRHGKSPAESAVCVFNFTPIPRHNYRVGVPSGGTWAELLNTDAVGFGGSGQGNFGAAVSHPVSAHGQPHSLNLTLPPLGAVILRADPSVFRITAPPPPPTPGVKPRG